MKLILLKDIPDNNIREAAIANGEMNWLTLSEKQIPDLNLINAFDWHRTLEGYEFWNYIYDLYATD